MITMKICGFRFE